MFFCTFEKSKNSRFFLKIRQNFPKWSFLQNVKNDKKVTHFYDNVQNDAKKLHTNCHRGVFSQRMGLAKNAQKTQIGVHKMTRFLTCLQIWGQNFVYHVFANVTFLLYGQFPRKTCVVHLVDVFWHVLSFLKIRKTDILVKTRVTKDVDLLHTHAKRPRKRGRTLCTIHKTCGHNMRDPKSGFCVTQNVFFCTLEVVRFLGRFEVCVHLVSVFGVHDVFCTHPKIAIFDHFGVSPGGTPKVAIFTIWPILAKIDLKNVYHIPGTTFWGFWWPMVDPISGNLQLFWRPSLAIFRLVCN